MQILTLEKGSRAATGTESKEQLSSVSNQAEALYVLHYRVRRLIELGFSNRALLVLNQWASRFQDRDRIRLQMRAYANNQFRGRYHALFQKLIQLPPSRPLIELIAAQLIVTPDPQFYAWVKQSFVPGDIAAPNEKLSSMVVLYLLAAAHDDLRTQEFLSNELKTTTGSNFAALSAVTSMAADPKRYRIEVILPAIQPLSLDMVYAMLERFETSSDDPL